MRRLLLCGRAFKRCALGFRRRIESLQPSGNGSRSWNAACKAWLWTVVGRLGTFFSARISRSRSMANELLAENVRGIVISDRYSAYSQFEDHCHQFCWAHLIRALSLFVFAHRESVSPTNSSAEQALRKAVIFRKHSFGREENAGSKNLSMILSVMETYRRLNHSCLVFIREFVSALFNNKPAPKLLPAH